MKRKRFTEQHIMEIESISELSKKEQDQAIIQLAQSQDRSSGSIRTKLHEILLSKGYTRKKKSNVWTDENIDKFNRMVAQNLHVQKTKLAKIISQEIGCSVATVINRLSKKNLENFYPISFSEQVDSNKLPFIPSLIFINKPTIERYGFLKKIIAKFLFSDLISEYDIYISKLESALKSEKKKMMTIKHQLNQQLEYLHK